MLPFSRMGFSPPFPGLSGLAPGKGQAIEGRPTILSTLSCWWKFVDLACQIKSYYCYLLIDGIIVVANQSLKTNLAKKNNSPQFKIMVLFTLLFRNGGCIQYQNLTKPNNGRPVDVSPSCLWAGQGRDPSNLKKRRLKTSLFMIFLLLMSFCSTLRHNMFWTNIYYLIFTYSI